jgi:hypothetical protein
MNRFLSLSISPESPFYNWPEAAIQLILEGKSVQEAKDYAAQTADAQIAQHREAIDNLQTMKTALRDLPTPTIPDEPVAVEAAKEA